MLQLTTVFIIPIPTGPGDTVGCGIIYTDTSLLSSINPQWETVGVAPREDNGVQPPPPPLHPLVHQGMASTWELGQVSMVVVVVMVGGEKVVVVMVYHFKSML